VYRLFFSRGGLRLKSLRGNTFYKGHREISKKASLHFKKASLHFKKASIPLKIYFKSLAILEKA
jgi:hypothetical protein